MSIEEERRSNCKYYQNTVDDLKKTVFGNGTPGIKADMISAKKNIDELQEDNKENKKKIDTIITIKTKLNIFIGLQITTLSLIIGAAVKIIIKE